MPIQSLPEVLLSDENLETLAELLIEKEALRRSIKSRKFGAHVTDREEAERLLAKTIRCTHEVLNLKTSDVVPPKLVLTKQLGKLPSQTLKSYLFFLPLSIILIFLGLRQSSSGPLLYVLLGTTLLLLLVPLLIHRRTRIHLEHQCGYRRDEKGEGEIVIDQLPSIQFQSYLVHEYAHHLYALKGEESERWIKEGWARLVQWEVSDYVHRLENDPTHLYPALVQIIGELKFACEMMASALHRRLPLKVRRIRTIYHRNPLFTLLTGTPGSKVTSLMDHAIGTATYVLAAERQGIQAALHKGPAEWF